MKERIKTTQVPEIYTDFVVDSTPSTQPTIYCEDCERWMYYSVHTCYCAKEERGEDISNCKCVIHGGNNDTVKER